MQGYDLEKAADVEVLRAVTSPTPLRVDRKAGIIRGVVIAQKGPFKTGRGEFDDDSLARTARLVNASPDGLKARYGHPVDEGSADELDSFIGRKKDAYLDGDKVRADLHFNPVAMMPGPNGGPSLADKLMTRAETDPRSFGSSLAVKADKAYRLDANGRRRSGLPIWLPTELAASDIVDNPDAVHDGFLSADLTDGELRQRWADKRNADDEEWLLRARQRNRSRTSMATRSL